MELYIRLNKILKLNVIFSAALSYAVQSTFKRARKSYCADRTGLAIQPTETFIVRSAARGESAWGRFVNNFHYCLFQFSPNIIIDVRFAYDNFHNCLLQRSQNISRYVRFAYNNFHNCLLQCSIHIIRYVRFAYDNFHKYLLQRSQNIIIIICTVWLCCCCFCFCFLFVWLCASSFC